MAHIGIVTIHKTTNYGGVFQALATQEVFRRYGVVEFVDYENEYVHKTIQLIRFGRGFRDVLRVLKDLARLNHRRRVIKKFKQFFDSYYCLSSPVSDLAGVSTVVKKYDILISGSDQIWNPYVVSEDCKFDDVFLLNFEHAYKCSYASSFGSFLSNNLDWVEKVAGPLSSFRYLSSRESVPVQLEDNLGKSFEVVLDPTLLLSSKEWFDLFGVEGCEFKELYGDYIFVYALRKDAVLKKVVEDCRKNNPSLKVVVFDQDPVLPFKADIHIKDASPVDFLKGLSSANLVVTNSFHGCAFSVNFNVDFIVSLPPTSPNRVLDLLSLVGLDNRLVVGLGENGICDCSEIEWGRVNSLLGDQRDSSFKFIDKIIHGIAKW